MLHWEDRVCDRCGSEGGELLFSGPDLLMNLPGEFRLVRCPTCGLIRQNPMLAWESLKNYYPEDYTAYEPIIAREPSRFKQADRRYGMWKRLRAIERYQNGGRLLDVGCGTGVFLGEAQRTGRWELMGVEPSPAAASYVQRELNIPVINERFVEAELPADHFDVITLWNVLEHLDHPVGDLRRAAGLLRPGGWLVFSIPNLESLEAKVFGRFWLGWDQPRHLYLFPQQQLRSILQELGMRLAGRRNIAGSHAAMEYSLRFWFNAKGWRSQGAHTVLRIYRSLPSRLVAAPFFWTVDQLKLGSLITIFAQKVSE